MPIVQRIFMPNFLIEFFYVLALSKKTQWALILGVVLHFAITLLGEHMVANLELQGSIKVLDEVISNKFLRKYDKIALFTLVSFWVLAVKFYIKDKKRLA
ncbi:hypothetical protein ACVBIV_12590 [Shewanella sp. 0m-9]